MLACLEFDSAVSSLSFFFSYPSFIFLDIILFRCGLVNHLVYFITLFLLKCFYVIFLCNFNFPFPIFYTCSLYFSGMFQVKFSVQYTSFTTSIQLSVTCDSVNLVCRPLSVYIFNQPLKK